MTARQISEAVWVAVFASFAVVAIGAYAAGMEGARGLVRRFTATRTRRVLVLIGCMWLGWHFFAR